MEIKFFRILEKQKKLINGVLLDAKNIRSKKWTQSKKKELANENITLFFRFYKHPLFLMLRMLNVLFILSPLVFLYFYFIPQLDNSFELVLWSLILGLLTFSLLFRSYAFWRINSYFFDKDGLTILSHDSVFSDEYEKIPTERISIMNVDQSGFFKIILNFGNLNIATIITEKDGPANTIFKNIYNPASIHKKIEINCKKIEKSKGQQKTQILHSTK